MKGFYPFVRRQNQDSSIDSICTTCYQTIASTNTVSDLRSAEQVHRCNPNGEFDYPHWDQVHGQHEQRLRL
jgi:hypothetical protein